MEGRIFLDKIMNGQIEVLCLFQNIAGIGESLCHDGIQDHVALCHGIPGTHHTELEFVSGEGKG